LAIRLDGGKISAGGTVVPLAVAEFFVFAFSCSQCLITECYDINFWTVFTSGYTTRVVWLMPSVVLTQFLLVANLDHHDHTGTTYLMPWGGVFAPWLVAISLWFLGETLCYPCCEEVVQPGVTFTAMDAEGETPRSDDLPDDYPRNDDHTETNLAIHTEEPEDKCDDDTEIRMEERGQ